MTLLRLAGSETKKKATEGKQINSKSQITNYKQIPNSNKQIPNEDVKNYVLDIV